MMTTIRWTLGAWPYRCVALFAGCSAIVLSSCRESNPENSSRSFVVDTLPNGALHVRNSADGIWAQSEGARWRVVESLRIGTIDGDGPDVFGRIGSVVEDAAGHVWIADPSANEVRVFDRNGEFIRTVGRRGEGPGEFGRLASVHLGPDGNIWVDDAGNRRWEVFDTAGVRVAGFQGNSNVGGGIRRWMSDGRLLEVNIVYPPGMSPLGTLMNVTPVYAVRHLDSMGGLIPGDTVRGLDLPDPERITFSGPEGRSTRTVPLPFAHNASSELGFHGDFWISEGGGAYLIRRQSLEGDTLLVFERAFEPVLLSDRARDRALEDLTPMEGTTSNDNDPARLPEVYPPFRSVHVSTDGSIWALRDLENDMMGLDVFSEDGIYLGQVRMEGDLTRLSLRLITEETIYAVETDDLGVQQVVLFRIERP